MDIETFLGIAFGIGTVIAYAIYRLCEKNTYLKYKDQKVGK